MSSIIIDSEVSTIIKYTHLPVNVIKVVIIIILSGVQCGRIEKPFLRG